MLTRTLPFKMVQTPASPSSCSRSSTTGGRCSPTAGRCRRSEPAWLGYSVGAGRRTTSSVETAGFNDKSWLDAGGTPHTEALRTTERFRRRDFGHMDVEFTFDDPKTFTRPVVAAVKFVLLPDTDLLESHCDNNKWKPRQA
jgi:hypothetical protein